MKQALNEKFEAATLLFYDVSFCLTVEINNSISHGNSLTTSNLRKFKIILHQVGKFSQSYFSKLMLCGPTGVEHS